MIPLLSIASILTTAGSLLAGQVGPLTYTPRSTGYDISYPQCGGAYPGGAFGVVGVNGGYPFVHYNPCLADQYARSPKAALYINTGYDPLYTQVDGSTPPPSAWRSPRPSTARPSKTPPGRWAAARPRAR